MRKIITTSGALIGLSDYQQKNNLKPDKLSKNFSVSEFDCDWELLLAQPLIELLQAFRDRIKKPVKINSGFRLQSKQDALREQGLRAAVTSPHVWGMAADIDTISKEQTKEYVKILKQVAKDLKCKIRLGYNQYLNDGKTFIHVDVCPMYYAPGKPRNKEWHPESWEKVIEW